MTRTETAPGFTLVEVMVALSILSLVLLGAVTGMRTLGNTQVSLERVTDRVDEVRTVSSFLRDLMESAVIGSSTGGLSLGGGSQEATYFRLGEGFLEWKTNLLFGEAFGGTYIVRLAPENDQLVLRWLETDATPTDPGKWANAPSRPLIHHLEQFTIAMRPDFASDWVDHWDDTDQAPALVWLHIKAAGRFWPELIMQVPQ